MFFCVALAGLIVLSLANMRMLIAVVEEGSFTRAADRVAATQSGVSQQIAKLERSLGVRLIERGAGRAVPTPAGRQLYLRAVAILSEIAAAESGSRDYGAGLVGEVSLGLMPAMTRSLAGPLLRRFLAANPNATVKVVEAVSSDLVTRVAAGQLDVAIVPVLDVPDGVTCRVIGRTGEVLVLRGRNDPDHMRPVGVADLPPFKLLLQSAGHVRRQRIMAQLRAREARVATLMELDSMFATLEFVAHSDYVTVLPAIMMMPEIADGSLCIRPIVDDGFAFDLMAIQRPRPAQAPLIAALVEEFADELVAFDATAAQASRRTSRPTANQKRSKRS